MRIIVDTNMIFSTLITPNSVRDGIFFDKTIEIFTAQKLWEELLTEEHQAKMRKCLKRHQADFEMLQEYIQSRIITVVDINPVYMQLAYEKCKDVDITDVDFVALSLQLGHKLWTGDKKLKKGLLAKGIDIFFDP
jgi:predicted nucleic acid-binding protein